MLDWAMRQFSCRDVPRQPLVMTPRRVALSSIELAPHLPEDVIGLNVLDAI